MLTIAEVTSDIYSQINFVSTVHLEEVHPSFILQIGYNVSQCKTGSTGRVSVS